MHKVKQERRESTLRRQINESFNNPNGTFSPSKAIAIVGQAVILAHTSIAFGELIKHYESLLICFAFIVCPDLIKKIVNMKYGKTNG